MASLSSTRNMFNFVLVLYFIGFVLMIARWRIIEVAGDKSRESDDNRRRDERDVPYGTHHLDETSLEDSPDSPLRIEPDMPILNDPGSPAETKAVTEGNQRRGERSQKKPAKKKEKKGDGRRRTPPETKQTIVQEPLIPVAEVSPSGDGISRGKTNPKGQTMDNADQTVHGNADGAVENPKDKTTKQTVDGTVGKTVDKTIGKTVDETIGKPVEETIGKPENETIGKPVDETIGKSVDETIGKPVEETIGKPVEETISKPVDETIDKTVGKTEGETPDKNTGKGGGKDTAQKPAKQAGPGIKGKAGPGRQKAVPKAKVSLTRQPDERALWEREQTTRRETLRRACAELALETNITQIAREQRRRLWPFIVEDKYRLIYTFISKVGSTNWKSAFLVLQGKYARVEDVPGKFAHSPSLVRLSSYTEDGVHRRLTNYTNFVFVRHPFARVLSAYRNKFLEHQSFARGTAIQIIKRYRQNATQEALAAGSDVTFPEFVKYLINGKVGTFDGHWQPVYRMILPCAVPFDFIGKLETGQADAEHILKATHVDHLIRFKESTRNVSHDESVFGNFFSQVPSDDLVRLYKVYEPDFKLFGYDVPDSMKDILGGI